VNVPLRLEAPAKLNLGLRVTGRRADGHHELDSAFVLLELADRLLLLPGCTGLRVEGNRGADLPLDERNLAWRGLVAGLGATPDLACLTLEKRIPAAAGLGGGSSDAGAAWRLGRAWCGRPDVPDAADLATLSRVGADVPFFASGLPAARVRGIGERLEAVPAEERDVVLVLPPFGLSTAAVFAELRREEWGTADNDLLAPACRLRPELVGVLDAVRRAGGEPRLTGSGSTIFSLTADSERAAAVAATLRRDGLAVAVTRTRTTPTRIQPIHEESSHDHP
jgi:4-diphosphocytidyl-2-C-methyl-D-erythritol kinase